VRGPVQTRGRASDVAGNPWNLATGGLKTLTAKRELPPRVERRSSDVPPESMKTQRNYTFVLVILACLVVMLVSGGIILYMMLQP
jgi:hypothetical protein